MRCPTKQFTDLTAGDLMSGDLLLLTDDMGLQEAARMLMRHRISGAPVVNQSGRMVGVLSSSDFVRLAGHMAGDEEYRPEPLSCIFQREWTDGEHSATICTLPAGACSGQQVTGEGSEEKVVCAQPHSVFCDWQMVEVESLPADSVRGYMSRDVITAERSTTLKELAHKMVDSHIHRVFVVDRDQAPLGIVTSTDILNAVAQMM
jgi:CBS domain-containing protein